MDILITHACVADEKVGGHAASGESFGKQLAATVGSALYSYGVTIGLLWVPQR